MQLKKAFLNARLAVAHKPQRSWCELNSTAKRGACISAPHTTFYMLR